MQNEANQRISFRRFRQAVRSVRIEPRRGFFIGQTVCMRPQSIDGVLDRHFVPDTVLLLFDIAVHGVLSVKRSRPTEADVK